MTQIDKNIILEESEDGKIHMTIDPNENIGETGSGNLKIAEANWLDIWSDDNEVCVLKMIIVRKKKAKRKA